MIGKRETVYVTKYALTKGILKVDAEITKHGGAYWGKHDSAYGEGRDWHRAMDGAIKRAEEMRKAKIASLTTQLAKLRDLTFGPSK